MANEFKVKNGVKFQDNTIQTTAAPSLTGTGASGSWAISVTGNAATATKLASIGTTFSGTYPVVINASGVLYSHASITYTGSTNTLSAGTFAGALSGNATTATTLQTARTINGVSFNGSANITLATVNTSGDQIVGGAKTFTSDIDFTAGTRWDVSAADQAHQRADARDDSTNFSRLHWYGVSDTGATSNFRHAWYDGANYVNVTAASGAIIFSGQVTATQFNGPLSGNAATVTNGVYTVGNQSIAGIKTFTNNTASTNTTTGSVVVTGGVGVSGNVNVGGALNAITKSFVIDHPTKPNKKLQYGSLEGPEYGVYVRGKLTNTNVIVLPDYWTGLIDPSTITVSLTPIGTHQNLFVEDIDNNQVVVGSGNLFGKPVNCFYVVYAERKDINKLQVEIE